MLPVLLSTPPNSLGTPNSTPAGALSDDDGMVLSDDDGTIIVED